MGHQVDTSRYPVMEVKWAKRGSGDPKLRNAVLVMWHIRSITITVREADALEGLTM